jgi:hypothetical protein
MLLEHLMVGEGVLEEEEGKFRGGRLGNKERRMRKKKWMRAFSGFQR